MKRLLLALAALLACADTAAAQTADTATVADTSHVYYLRQVEVPPQLRNGEQITRRIARVYPDSLRAQGASGTVMLRFVVDARGHVEPGSIEVVSSTNPAFEQPARGTAQQMLFSPAALSGKPVRVEVTLPLQFALRQ